MAKIPYPTRLEPQLLDSIKVCAKQQNRSVNNMIEVLLEYGVQYFNEISTDKKLIVRNSIENQVVNNTKTLV